MKRSCTIGTFLHVALLVVAFSVSSGCAADGSTIAAEATPPADTDAWPSPAPTVWFTKGAPKYMEARAFADLDCPTNAWNGPGSFDGGDPTELPPDPRTPREIAAEFFADYPMKVLDRYGTGKLVESAPFIESSMFVTPETRMNVGVPNSRGGILAYVELTKFPQGWIFTNVSSCSLASFKD